MVTKGGSMKHALAKVAIVFAASLVSVTAHAYAFFQTGWENYGGIIVTGTFQGKDLNHDGWIKTDELESFVLSWKGTAPWAKWYIGPNLWQLNDGLLDFAWDTSKSTIDWIDAKKNKTTGNNAPLEFFGGDAWGSSLLLDYLPTGDTIALSNTTPILLEVALPVPDTLSSIILGLGMLLIGRKNTRITIVTSTARREGRTFI